jgi:hypothetical protein
VSVDPDPERLEELVRRAVERLLPGIVSDVRRELLRGAAEERPEARVRVRANLDALPVLLEAARVGGRAAVLPLLGGDPEALRGIAAALDRVLAQRVRKVKDLERVKEQIADEVVRQATRNDVFLPPR